MNKPALRSGKAKLICCGPSFFTQKVRNKYWWRSETLGQKSRVFLTLLGIYSIGVKMTLKVESTPMETTDMIGIEKAERDERFG